MMRSLLFLLLTLAIRTAMAHEMSMAEMQVQEIAPGELIWQWNPSEKRPAHATLRPVWPEGCTAGSNTLHCSGAGLAGTLAVDGIGRDFSAAMIRITWLDGQSRVYTLTSAQPTARLYGSADDRRSLEAITLAYTLLGIEHILTGYDHQLFVIGLLFLVGFSRRLLWTITAFTAAHSVTLALSATGWLLLRSAPVEAIIALSIVLVTGEALHGKPTLARRFPALVAFLFGLVHGLGFAGALREVGLPENHLSAALLTFNIGVELGQLLIVAVAWLLWRLAIRLPGLVRARSGILYVMGTLAAYWSWERAAAILN